MQATQDTSRATDILRAEHDVILDVLDCLENIARIASIEWKLDVRSAEDSLAFLAEFADGCHHRKEEGALFPLLVKKGLPQEVGPLAVMLSEHQQGRAHIAEMYAALDERNDAKRAAAFSTHAGAYVDLLRAHIAKENNVLFPMADKMLAGTEQASLLQAFSRVESRDLGPGIHEGYVALAAELSARLGLARSSRSLGKTGGCCGHA